jgi:hypothetical protein
MPDACRQHPVGLHHGAGPGNCRGAQQRLHAFAVLSWVPVACGTGLHARKLASGLQGLIAGLTQFSPVQPCCYSA